MIDLLLSFEFAVVTVVVIISGFIGVGVWLRTQEYQKTWYHIQVICNNCKQQSLLKIRKGESVGDTRTCPYCNVTNSVTDFGNYIRLGVTTPSPGINWRTADPYWSSEDEKHTRKKEVIARITQDLLE